MAEDLVELTGTTVTHDETAALQNSVATPAPPNPAGDADDDDVLLATLPPAFSARLIALDFDPDGAIGAAASPGNVVTFTPTGTLGNIALTDANGAPLDGDDSGLVTTGGEAILLYTDTNDNIVLGKTAGGTLVFAIYLEETGGLPPTGAKLWTIQYEAIDHGDDNNDHDSAVDLTDLVHVTAFEEQSFSFSNAPSGQNLFMAFGNSSQAVLVTGEDPANQSAGQNVSNDGDTVNTGQGGGATTLGTEGQQIKAQKALVVTFVSGADPNLLVPNLSPGEAGVESNIDFTGYVLAQGADITISQMTPGGPSTTATVELAAYLTADASDIGYIDDNPLVTGDTAINIDTVQVIRNGVDVVGTLGVSVNYSGSTAVITGVKDDDIIRYTTDADHNRVLIRNDQPASGSGSNVSFDLGGFTITEVSGDIDEVGSKIFFEDDGPAIDLTPTTATIAVDESVGTGGSSKDEPGNADPDDETAAGAPADAIGYAVTSAATLFSETADAGTDGQASKVYELVLNAGATGLTDTATDEAVVLSLVGGAIEGRTATSDDLVFTIAVNGTTGEVTTTQYRALDHGADANDHDSAASMASGLVELTATLTDGDTDFDADTIELGSRIGFEDDGPAIDLTPTTATIAVDESVGTGGSSKDEPGNADPDDETAAGAPADAIGYAVTSAATLFSETADAGTDGQASKVYELVLNAGATGLTDTATDEAVVLSLVGGAIEGRTATSDDLVFTIAVNGTTGEVTTTQYRALDHGADANDHDSAASMASGLVELTATLTDGDTDFDADTIELGSRIGFEDDGPAIDLTPTTATIAVDESVGTGGSSKDEPGNADPDDETAAGAPADAIGYAVTSAATLFSETADAGTDGQASKVYELVLNAGATGLTDTATDEAVVLSLVGGAIEGRTATSDDLVFTIAVNGTTGEVTTTQYRALDHGADANDHDSAASMASGLVELTATLTDGDTDFDADTIELGSRIGFEDDGPAIDLTPTTATIAVDESVGTGGSSKDEPGNADPDDETAAGAPADAIGYAVTSAATLFSETADAGTDGQASKVYELVLNAGATGLTDTATDEAVVLSLVGGAIEGRTATSDDLVFTIAVNGTTGEVTTTQYRALDHGADANDHDSAASMASGLVELTATLTDGDTDFDADTIELGSRIGFEDDGPAIDLTPTTATIAVDESVGTGGSSKDEPGNADPDDETAAGAPADAIGYAVTSAATLFSETADAGTDGQASKVYELVLNAGATGLTDTATDEAVVLSLVGGAIEGRTATSDDLVFTIAVNGTTGEVTTTQYRALDHGADANDHDSAASMASGLVELTATLTDGDTDFDADTIELGSRIGFEDDGPAIDLTPTTATIAVDESVGTGGSSKDEPGNADPDDETAAGAPADAIGYAVTSAATLFSETADAGTDGQASKVYELVLNAGATGLTDTATDEAVVLSLVGGAIEGRTATSDDLVFTIAVNGTTGEVTTTQYRALDHGADANDHDSAASMASGLVELTATLTDGDTDFDADTIELGSRIGFEDDGPAIDLTPTTATIAVDESVGTGGSSKDEPGNADPDDETAAGAPADAIGYAVTSAATLFSETADAGTDGQASKVYELVLNAGATGLTDTATDEAVVLSLVGGAIEGRTATSDDLVFTIAVNGTTGEVTTTQYRALDHGADANDHDSAASMASGLVELTATLTDGDTDFDADTIELGSRIGFEDDGPAITVDDATGTYAAGAAGIWDHDPGTDGFGSLSVNLDSYEIDSNGTVDVDAALTQTGDFAFEGSITDDFNGDGTDETVDFTLTFDPDDPETYELEVTTPPATIRTFDTSQGSLPPGGPTEIQTLFLGGDLGAGNDDIVFFGAVATAPIEGIASPPTNDIEDLVVVGESDLTEAQIALLLPLPGLITPGTQMNVSTSGIGINNNNLNGANEGAGTGAFAGTTITSGDESFVVNPETVVDKVRVFIDNSVGGYTVNTEDLYYTVYYTDGTTSGPTDVTAPIAVPNLDPNDEFPDSLQGHGQYFDIDGGDKQIDAVQLTMGRGTIKIPVIQFSVEEVFDPEPLHLEFTATLFDGDGDNQQDPFKVDLSSIL